MRFRTDFLDEGVFALTGFINGYGTSEPSIRTNRLSLVSNPSITIGLPKTDQTRAGKHAILKSEDPL
jgi:hypothetical protein